MTDSPQRIFEQVCDLEGDERNRVIAGLCGDDPGVRAEVDSLLYAHDSAGEFLGDLDWIVLKAIDQDRLTIVSGMLGNRKGLPDVTFRHFDRVTHK